MKKSLKHVYKELMNERYGTQAGSVASVDSDVASINAKWRMKDDKFRPESATDSETVSSIAVNQDALSLDEVITEEEVEHYVENFLLAIGNKLNSTYTRQIKIVDEAGFENIKTLSFSYDNLISYIYYLYKIDEIDLIFENNLNNSNFILNSKKESVSLLESDSSNNNVTAETLKKLIFEDAKKKSTQSVANVVSANSLNAFKAYMFYFLYKKLIKSNAKLTIKDKPNYDEFGSQLSIHFEKLFKSLLINKQSAFTVNFGTLFEEIFKAQANAVIKDDGEGNTSYKDVISSPNKYGIEIDLKHRSKQISIALILFCNGKFNNSSSVFNAVNNNTRPIENNYYEDLRDNIAINTESQTILKQGILAILDIYKDLLDIDNLSNLKCDDYEKDNDKSSGFLLPDYKSNSPFDFIVKHKDFINSEVSHAIGLFDLKASNVQGSSSSTPLSIGSTGNNGGTMNSALTFIKDIVKKGSAYHNDFVLKFFGLIQIEYEIDFTIGDDKDIVISNVSHKIGEPKSSVSYSVNKEKFYLATTDANGDFIKSNIYSNDGTLNFENTTYTNENELNFKTIARDKSGKHIENFAKCIIDLYKKYNSLEACISNHDFKLYKPVICNSINLGLLGNLIENIADVDNVIVKKISELDTNNDCISKLNNNNLSLVKIQNIFVGFFEYFLKSTNNLIAVVLKKYLDNEKIVSAKDRWLDSVKDYSTQPDVVSPKFRKTITNNIVSLWGDPEASADNANYNASTFINYINRSIDSEVKKYSWQPSGAPRSEPILSAMLGTNKLESDDVQKINNAIKSKVKEIFTSLSEEDQSSDDLQPVLDTSSYVRSGKTLMEIYSYLFDSKKTINEGALGGHMMHPYEALDMTPEQLTSRIKQYGVPQKIIEKVDGQNLFFTVETDGTLLFARNKEDMTHDDLVEKFTGHPAEKPFIEGGNAIKAGVESLLNRISQEEVIRLFHPSEGIRTFVNFEIMHPEKPNQIIYDEKYIVFHGIVDYRNGREEVSRSNQDQRIQELVSLMSSGVSSAGFTLASNREVDLNQLTDIQIAEYTQKIYDISEALGMEEGETLGDGIMNVIGDEIEAEGVSLSDEALTIFTDYIVRGEDSEGRSIASKEWTKLLSKEDVAKLRQLGLTSTSKVKTKIGQILQPFKALFVELGIDLLKGVQSSYMSADMNIENVELIRDKLGTAISDLENYISSVPEEEWSNSVKRLIPHMELINRKGLDNIVSSAVEGGVYSANDNLFKVTGGFAPMNQIIGAAYRDKEDIFTTFKEKFMQQENNRRSLRDIFSLIF